MSKKSRTEKQDGLLELERPRPTSLPPLPDHPLVSVITPSRNNATFLEQTIHSVLQQDYEPIELIIVDGASTDGTLDILREYEGEPRVRWISEPDSGPIEACNKGFRLARGDLVGLLPVTDTYDPGAIRTLVSEFVNDPKLAQVSGWTREIDEHGLFTGYFTMLQEKRVDYALVDVLRFSSLGRAQAALMRRDVLLRIGGFDEHVALSHSYFGVHYALEALSLGAKLRAIPMILASFRKHPNQRHTLDAFSQLPSYHARNYGCKRLAKLYKDYLSPEQVRLLRRSGYYFVLRHCVRVRQFGPAIPAALGYLWFGGGPHMLRYLLKALRASVRRLVGYLKPGDRRV